MNKLILSARESLHLKSFFFFVCVCASEAPVTLGRAGRRALAFVEYLRICEFCCFVVSMISDLASFAGIIYYCIILSSQKNLCVW